MTDRDATEITHENIQAIYDHEEKERAKLSRAECLISDITEKFSSPWCIVIHLIIFATWIIVNLYTEWDPFPFVLLITVVSLESIFLTLMVLIVQRHQSRQADRRHALDLQINLLAEQESTAMLRLLDKMAAQLAIPEKDRKELKTFFDDTNPTDVLEQIVQVEEKKV